MLDPGLHLRFWHAGVICRASLKNDSNIRFDNAGRDHCPAHVKLFLRCHARRNVHGKGFAIKGCKRAEQSGTPQAAIKCLAPHKIIFGIVCKRSIWNNRLARRDSEYGYRLFARTSADVDGHVRLADRLKALFVRHIMDGLAGDHPRDPLPRIVADAYRMCRQRIIYPATQRDEFDRSIFPHGMHHESNFITVRIQKHHRSLTRVAVASNIKVAHGI